MQKEMMWKYAALRFVPYWDMLYKVKYEGVCHESYFDNDA